MKWLALICIVVIVPSTAQKLCCQNNDAITSNLTISCKDSTSLDLDCQSNITYLLEAETDKYEFTAGGALYLMQDAIEIPRTDYCLCNLYHNNGSVRYSVAIVCDRSKDVENADIGPTIFEFLKILSSTVLIVSIVIYIIQPEIRDLQGHCTLQFLINYNFTYLIVNILHHSGFNICLSKAYLFYFFSLSSFIWLGITAFNVWKTLYALGNTNQTRTLIRYLLFGYGLAVLWLLLMLLIQHCPGDHFKLDFTEVNCWFQESESRWWYYYFPIVFILVVTTLLFLDSYRKIRRAYQNQVNGVQGVAASCDYCCLYFKLYLIVGTTWFLEILSTNFALSFRILLLVTELLNSIQGILIFSLLIATRWQVLQALLNYRPCRLSCFSTSWTVTNNAETQEQVFQVRYVPRDAEVTHTSINE